MNSVDSRKNNELDDRDLRLHRKYIYVTLIILIFIHVGEIDMGKINFNIVEFELKNQYFIEAFLIFLLIFSTFRYWQFYWSGPRNTIQERYRNLKEGLLNKRAESEYFNFLKNENTNMNEYTYKKNKPIISKDGGLTIQIDHNHPKQGMAKKIILSKKELIKENRAVFLNMIFNYPEVFNYWLPIFLGIIGVIIFSVFLVI